MGGDFLLSGYREYFRLKISRYEESQLAAQGLDFGSDC